MTPPEPIDFKKESSELLETLTNHMNVEIHHASQCDKSEEDHIELALREVARKVNEETILEVLKIQWGPDHAAKVYELRKLYSSEAKTTEKGEK